MGVCRGGPGTPQVPFTCIFTGLDGLPVELLDFTIDEDDATGATEEEEPNTAKRDREAD